MADWQQSECYRRPDASALRAGREPPLSRGHLGVRPVTDHSKRGNQQKVVIAKSLVQDPSIVIFGERTRGVDVGTIPEIHAQSPRPVDVANCPE
jgi:hypothetical protein